MKKIFTLTLMILTLLCIISSCGKKENEEINVNFEVKQIEAEQKLEVKWESNKSVEKINIEVKHGERQVSSIEYNVKDGIKNGSLQIDAFYGKHQLEIEIELESGEKYKESTEVCLSAPQYIVAPISGSMPQLYFTLNMKEITNDGKIPAFVWLDRPEAWNWDNLPENVFPMPTVDKKEVLKHSNYNKMIEETNKYIKELFEINKDSKFSLYINDYNAYLYVKMLVANGIPEDHFYVTLLSDGGASYVDFNKAFDSEDPNFDADAKYDEMVKNLDLLYKQAIEKQDYYYGSDFVVDTDEFRQYSYVAAREKDNVEWWILRPRDGVLRSPDKEFINRVLTEDKTEGIIEERNFSSPLKEMNDEEKNELKNLYNFNEEMFGEAEKQGKKAMMILGSWADEAHEPQFEAYVNLIKNYYGDEFVYYYKGHPNTPTSINPQKQKQLEKLGLIDVESSINAELILFFYPDIYMCGYNSSTFLSVESPEMACAIFNMKKDECKSEYKDLIGFFTTKIDNPKESVYADICNIEGHEYFLMEFNRISENGADIGIYDFTANKISYYKSVDGKFEAIDANKGK